MKNPSEIMNPEALLAHGTFVRTLAGRLVQDAHLAEDITQETWLAAIKNSPDEPRSIRAWLHTVARNFARRAHLDAGRRHKREKAAARPESVRSTLEIVEQENIRSQVVEVVLELNEPYRSAILFRFYDDLPPREIARRQDVPVETVKTRIQRGLEQLRIKLDRSHGGNRKNWCLALAPIAGWKLATTATGAAGGSLIVTGITAMTTKMKIAIAVVILLGAAFTFTQFLPDEMPRVGHDIDASPASLPGDEFASSDTGLITQPLDANDRVVMQASPMRILGRTVDADATPLGEINGYLLGEGGVRISTTTSNEAGALQFELKPASKPVALILEAPGWLPEAWPVPTSEEPMPMIDLGDLTLHPAGILELNLGTADGTRLPPVEIQLLDEQDNPVLQKEGLPETVRKMLGKIQEIPPFHSLEMPVSLPSGRLAFTVPVGTWRLRVESKEHPLIESDLVEVWRDALSRVFLEFVPAGEITGVCMGPDGLPLAGVKMGAMPVRFEKSPEDYTIVPENQMSGEKGTTITETTYVTTNRDGLFRFFPIPAHTYYEVWCEDSDFMELEVWADQRFKEHIFAAGVEDLRFVLRKTPNLIIRLEDEGGMEPVEGQGIVHVAVDYSGWGTSEVFTLMHSTCTLPIPHGTATGGRRRLDQDGTVQVKVFWSGDRFGQTSVDLPWYADQVRVTVRLVPCMQHNLGHIPFMASLIHTCWNGLKKSSLVSLPYCEKPYFPRWNWEERKGVHFMLGREDETGDYWITSSGYRLEWAVFWDETFQKIGLLTMDTESEIPRVKEKRLFCEAEKIVIQLAEETELSSDEEIWCSIEAWYPDICGDRRLGQWGVNFDNTPGKMVLIWPSSPYQYKPAPGATATMWRPKGLKYTMKVYLDDSEYHRTVRRESFLLNEPKLFTIKKNGDR